MLRVCVWVCLCVCVGVYMCVCVSERGTAQHKMLLAALFNPLTFVCVCVCEVWAEGTRQAGG